MPLKLSVGVSRKVGQPGYGSVGAACGVEVECESALLRDAPEEFERRARSAYAACARAVDAELARLAVPTAPAIAFAGHAETTDARGRPPRPATPRQRRALEAIARSRGVEPGDLLVGHGLDAGTLSASEASRLISGLRAAAGRPAASTPAARSHPVEDGQAGAIPLDRGAGAADPPARGRRPSGAAPRAPGRT